MKLPRTMIPVPKIEDDCYDWWERHEACRKAASAGPHDVVLIGDSITHFWNDPAHCNGGTTCQETFGTRRVLNLGFGYDRPQNVLWRLQHGEFEGQQPAVIIVNLGTNCFSITDRYDGDSPEDAARGVAAVLEQLRRFSPASRRILMAVFPRGGLHEEWQPKIDRLNHFLKYYSDAQGVPFLDLSEKFRAPDGRLHSELFVDGCCHPNAEGYRIWGNALQPWLRN